MKLHDLTQKDYNLAEEKVIQLIQESRPDLDLRLGTALRDLLIRPSALIQGISGKELESLRTRMSLKTMTELGVTDEGQVAAILSNFLVTPATGSVASGKLIIRMASPYTYQIPKGFEFSTKSNVYATLEDYTLVTDYVGVPKTLHVQKGPGYYYFILPVSSVGTGVSKNIPQGTTLEINSTVFSFTEATAYTNIDGGQDSESVASSRERAATAITVRGMYSSKSITATLTDLFKVKDVSTVGYGNPEMTRDRHNVLNVATGGCTDVYVRMEERPNVETVEVTAAKVRDGVYTFSLNRSNMPGAYAVRGVGKPENVFMSYKSAYGLPLIGSLPYHVTYGVYQNTPTYHEVLTTKEAQGSVWSSMLVTVTDVPPISDGTYPQSLKLKADVYIHKGIEKIQDYVDDARYRNRLSDCVVKGATPCFVTVSCTLYTRTGSELDIPAIKERVATFVNSKKFGERLTVSQIVALLHSYNIVQVGESSSDQILLEGVIGAHDGTSRKVNGPVLDMKADANLANTETEATTVYMTATNNIFITEKLV